MSFGWVSDLLLLTSWLKVDRYVRKIDSQDIITFTVWKGFDLLSTCQCSVFLLCPRRCRRLSQSGAEAVPAVPLKAKWPKPIFWSPDGFFASGSYRAPHARAPPVLRSLLCWGKVLPMTTSSMHSR